MSCNAVIDDALSYVKRCGACSFTPGSGETVVPLNSLDRPEGVPLYHLTVTAGDLVELGAAEKAAVDAALAALAAAMCEHAARVDRSYANAAALPLPPPEAGLVVVVDDTGSGDAGLALSGASSWFVFVADSEVT